MNSHLRERGVFSGPRPPDPEPEIYANGLTLDRDYYNGPYYFKGTKVRAMLMDIGTQILVSTAQERISYDYGPYNRTWTASKRTYINKP